jgi:PAP2 superfamily
MKLPVRPMANSIGHVYRAHPIKFWLQTTTVLGVALLFMAKRNFWTPDILFVVMLAVFVVFGKARNFLYRFVPFIGLLLVYDSFRGIADNLNQVVHYTPMIDADKFLFAGTLPTLWLQHALWHGQVEWIDFYFYFLYTLHFLAPVGIALLMWWKRDKLYWPYIWGFIILSFAGFLTYVLFPAAPPWMAAQHGYISEVHRISSDIWYAMGVTNFSELYSKISPNEVAAVPSLHAAYPTLIVLFMARAFGWRKMWWLVLYPISLWIGIVYLGEHYVFDALLGIGYAVAAYAASLEIFAWKRAGGLTRLIHPGAWERGFLLGQRIRTGHHITLE